MLCSMFPAALCRHHGCARLPQWLKINLSSGVSTPFPGGDPNWGGSRWTGNRITAGNSLRTALESPSNGAAGPEIYVLSIGTQTLKTISIRGWANGISLDWVADGSGFFICTLKPRAVLLHVDLEGHATPLWEPKGSTTTWALPSPDGRHIAMPSGVVNSNAWMIQQF